MGWQMIVVIAMCLILVAGLLEMKRRENIVVERVDPIDEVRDAAFEVIEASLLEEPERWTAISYDSPNEVYWLVNNSANVAIWTANQSFGLYVIRGSAKIATEKDKVTPNPEWRDRLWNAANPIVRKKAIRMETDRLKGLVNGFKRLTEGEEA